MFVNAMKSVPAPSVALPVHDIINIIFWVIILIVITAASLVAVRYIKYITRLKTLKLAMPKGMSKEAKEWEEKLKKEFEKPELSQAELELKRKEVENILKILKEEYEEGILSEASYQELRGKNERMLVHIERQIMSLIKPETEKVSPTEAEKKSAEPEGNNLNVLKRLKVMTRKPVMETEKTEGLKSKPENIYVSEGPESLKDKINELINYAETLRKMKMITKEEFKNIKKRAKRRLKKARKEQSNEFRKRIEMLERDLRELKKLARSG